MKEVQIRRFYFINYSSTGLKTFKLVHKAFCKIFQIAKEQNKNFTCNVHFELEFELLIAIIF